MQPPKQISPVKVKKSVSVAAIFKQKPQKAKSDLVNLKRATDDTKAADCNAVDGKAPHFKSRSSSRTPKKGGSRVSKKSDSHPLAVAFKSMFVGPDIRLRWLIDTDTSDDYRRHLYGSTTLKINTTLEHLLTHLYEASLQPVSSDPTNGDASPLRLTVSAKYERKALKLYQPISAYKVGLTHTNTDGTRIQLMSTLESRMADYDEYIAKHKAELVQLKADWEAIVGEIWKLGVQCLGEELMEPTLFTDKDGMELSSPSTRTESMLFVPEQGTSPRPRTKKRVTFDTPDDEDELPGATNSALAFLYQPTRVRLAPVPAAPAMPKKEVENLEKQVEELGQKELEEYRKAERDYSIYWQKKNKRLAQVLAEDWVSRNGVMGRVVWGLREGHGQARRGGMA
jgi:hypothetical protein